MSNNDLMSVAQAAKFLNLSTRAVHHRITSGALPAQKLGSGTSQYVLRRTDVEAAAKAVA